MQLGCSGRLSSAGLAGTFTPEELANFRQCFGSRIAYVEDDTVVRPRHYLHCSILQAGEIKVILNLSASFLRRALRYDKVMQHAAAEGRGASDVIPLPETSAATGRNPGCDTRGSIRLEPTGDPLSLRR